MRVMVFQASDIHLSSERYPDNPVLGRVPKLITAVQSLFLQPGTIGGVLLLVTGDVAYGGLQEEYSLAMPFFRELQTSLKAMFPAAEHRVLFIPGNHDCNFEDDDQARRKLIEDPDPDMLADGSIVMAATVVQTNFFEFCRQFSGDTKGVEGLDRLYCPHEFQVGGKRILVRALNSAWTSRIPETRNHMLPVQYLARRFAEGVAPAVVITTLHHPYNWFEPNNARALRKLLEETSDLVLTGHEHSAETYAKTGLAGEQIEYIEGGVLQEAGDPTSTATASKSTFIIAAHLTWTSVQTYDPFGYRPHSGESHGHCHSRRLHQKILRSPQRPSGTQSHQTSPDRHHGHCPLRCYCQLRYLG